VNSSRPYILRALYDWIVDNDCTPHILVDAMQPGVEVPSEYVKDGQIVLNVSPTAVIDLHLSNHLVTFNGRFGGRPMDVAFPVTAVLGIYARENGQGMVFEPDEPPEPPEGGPPPADGPGSDDRRSAGRPSLKVVK
jgi:stringent starvation protein B